MFQSLSDRLSSVLDKLTKRGALSESDVAEAMREVRRALLEADVALDVVRDFTERVRAKAIGQEVLKSVTPGQMVVKIVNDELVRMLGSDAAPIDLHAAPPVAILMAGLQGSGKTTTTAKIAWRLKNRDKKKVLMASLDTRRPAAQEQLRVLGEQTEVATLPIVAGQSRSQIAKRALEAAKLGGYDVVLLDTAGRTTLDEELMVEVAEIKAATNPHEILLVVDSLTGQDAVNTAKAFDSRLCDHRHGADARRRRWPRRCGAVHARRHGQADQALGTGEKWDALEDFDPKRIAGRILGMGDIVGLVEKAAQTIDVEKATVDRPEDEEGRLRSRGSRRAAGSDGEARRHGRRARHAARRRQDQGADQRRQPRRPRPEASARDHLLDDAQGAARAEGSRRQAQAAHRCRLRHQGRGHQQAHQDAPADGRHDEAPWARTAA